MLDETKLSDEQKVALNLTLAKLRSIVYQKESTQRMNYEG
jgi:hypothetical protein